MLMSEGCCDRQSILTSVYGLYAGLKRMFSMPIFLKNTLMKPKQLGQNQQTIVRVNDAPIRSARVRSRSATTPST